ncbi:MAG: hypothetical protein IJS32_01730 [Kiritimatiellae bacterium]|nr:hypothetical protein [Kiritimatiellia bacterium]
MAVFSRARPGALALAAGVLLSALAAPALADGAAPAAPAVLAAPAEGVYAALRASYEGVSNLTCVVRREMPLPGGKTVRVISRVAWARGNRLASVSVSPPGRKVVIDGEKVYDRREAGGAVRVRALSDQSTAQKANQVSVPASPEEYLLPFDGAEARDIPPAKGEARRVLFVSPEDAVGVPPSIAAGFAADGRVTELTYFLDRGGEAPGARLRFLLPREVLPGAWLYAREELADADGRTAVSRFDELAVNADLPASLFSADGAFDE